MNDLLNLLDIETLVKYEIIQSGSFTFCSVSNPLQFSWNTVVSKEEAYRLMGNGVPVLQSDYGWFASHENTNQEADNDNIQET
ncbi:hypothetical protein [Vibrio panuliri]|uniref:Uncharacterized protein n=1 Tax=Vibrio panuliri TaxID=1381081 RepID=A0ABX3FFL7_9VIBR|nr:hypothetical protein [Vibrio panuliri]KAB1460858.1 hypothetical protein F7O85_00340 [Vibrio panuliri]OLQ91664.1 hypothetical protein BIY20_09685 [Vibrio panuliri]